ncbi:hypothetical protein [Okeania sp. SIO2F5]|nr:hypothetical protein [Okeania sp. SIO2F5]
MSAKIIFTITQGTLKGKQFLFEERTTCVIGNSSNCLFHYPSLN